MKKSRMLRAVLLGLAIGAAISLMSCDNDTCYDCYDVTRTTYSPYAVTVENICVEYDCEY